MNASNPFGIPEYAEKLSKGMMVGIVEWQQSVVLLDISHITLFSNMSLPRRWAPSHSPFFPPFFLPFFLLFVFVRIVDFS